MQLVVMAAVMVLVEAGQGCIFGCHPTNISIPLHGCGITELVYTTVCAGQCFNKDPVYISRGASVEQKTCNGDWSYEVKHIEGCPEGVTYPVARNCWCMPCNVGNEYCGDLMESYPAACPFK